MLVELIVSSLLLLPAIFTQDYPAPRAGGFGDCNLPTENDTILGSNETFSNVGLLPSLFASGDGSSAPFLRIVRSRLTCVTTGFTSRFTASSVSFIVEYERQDNQGVIVRAQVSVDCIPDPNNPAQDFSFYPMPSGSDPRTASVSAGSILRDNTNVSYNTALRVDCSECSEESGSRGDLIARCLGCADECNNMGSRRCVGLTQLSGQCCPYFLEDRCVLSCPSPLTPNDMTFDCGCGTLSINNGDVSYTAAQRVGSVATYTCNEGAGYILPLGTPTQRTCALNGWSGSSPTCQLHDCKETSLTSPPNGDYSLQEGMATTFGARVTYKCNDGYNLVGEMTVRECTLQGWSGSTPRCEKKVLTCPNCNSGTCDEDTGTCVCPDGKSGDNCLDDVQKEESSSGSACGTPCIIGIVLAVVGAVILVAIVAGVAYGIFSYLNHPDTKMAKFDNENFNGVARDNPLYVDPEAVVGDGAEAA